jgi:hypothetical protein
VLLEETMSRGQTRRKKKRQNENGWKQFEKQKSGGKRSTERWKKNEKK